jgi:putative membrane protein
MTLAETCTGHPAFPFLFPLFFLLVLLVVARPWRRRRWHAMSGLSVLAERYARGEIDEQEYRARRQVLRDR